MVPVLTRTHSNEAMLVDCRTTSFRAGHCKDKAGQGHPGCSHCCLAGGRLNCNRLLLLPRILAAGDRSKRSLECMAKQVSCPALSDSRRTHGEQLSPTLFLSAPCLLFTWRRGNLRRQSHLHFRFACSDVSCLSRDRHLGSRADWRLVSEQSGFWPHSREHTPAMSA